MEDFHYESKLRVEFRFTARLGVVPDDEDWLVCGLESDLGYDRVLGPEWREHFLDILDLVTGDDTYSLAATWGRLGVEGVVEGLFQFGF